MVFYFIEKNMDVRDRESSSSIRNFRGFEKDIDKRTGARRRAICGPAKKQTRHFWTRRRTRKGHLWSADCFAPSRDRVESAGRVTRVHAPEAIEDRSEPRTGRIGLPNHSRDSILETDAIREGAHAPERSAPLDPLAYGATNERFRGGAESPEKATRLRS